VNNIVRNFQILIVSAVKIYKRCLQTAPISGDFIRGRRLCPSSLYPSNEKNEKFLGRPCY